MMRQRRENAHASPRASADDDGHERDRQQGSHRLARATSKDAYKASHKVAALAIAHELGLVDA